jgi:hypothetical protein
VIHHVTLNDCLEPSAPPQGVLVVGVTDDTAFIAISKVTTDGKSETTTAIAEIAVSAASLRDALHLLGEDRDREDLRPKTGNDRDARLGGHRFIAARL